MSLRVRVRNNSGLGLRVSVWVYGKVPLVLGLKLV